MGRKPGLGLGELRFGASRDEVEAYLGAPEEIDEYELGDSKTVAWYYRDRGISAHFEEDEEYRLGALQVDNPEVTLSGQRFIGVPEAEMVLFLGAMGAGEVTTDADPDYRSIAADDLWLTFYIEKGCVISVQWGPLIDENDEFIWPKRVSSG